MTPRESYAFILPITKFPLHFNVPLPLMILKSKYFSPKASEASPPNFHLCTENNFDSTKVVIVTFSFLIFKVYICVQTWYHGEIALCFADIHDYVSYFVQLPHDLVNVVFIYAVIEGYFAFAVQILVGGFLEEVEGERIFTIQV